MSSLLFAQINQNDAGKWRISMLKKRRRSEAVEAKSVKNKYREN